MGLELEFVQSDPNHSVTFLCSICNGLADMNAVVTVKCSHPFCKSCIDEWLTKSSACPTCKLPMDKSSSRTNVAMLKSSQPLAHICMSRIKVRCPQCSTWTGEYGQLQGHLDEIHVPRESAPQERGRKSATRRGSEAVLIAHEVGSALPLRQSINTTLSTPLNGRQAEQRRKSGVLSQTSSESLSQSDHQKERLTGTNPSQNKTALSDAGLLKEKGNAKFNKGEYAEAGEFYDRALALINNMTFVTNEERHAVAGLYCNRGATFAKKKLTDEALRDYDTAISIAPDFQKAYTRKCKILVSKARLTEAKEFLETAVLNLPGDKTLQEELKSTKRILEEIQRIQEMLTRQQFREAYQAGSALMKTTDNVEAVLLSAEADASTGVVESAMEKCEFALKNDSSNSTCWQTKAFVTLLSGDAEAAQTCIKEALKLDPSNMKAKKIANLCRKVHTELSAARLACENPDRSRTSLKKSVEMLSSIIEDSTVPSPSLLMCILRTERGECALRLMHYSSALEDADSVIKTNQKYIQAWILKTNTCIATGRAHEARSDLETAKRSWAVNQPEILAAYKRADFEAKVIDADEEIRASFANGVPVFKSEQMIRSDHQPGSKLRDSRRPSYESTNSTSSPTEEIMKSDHQGGSKVLGSNVRLMRRPSYDPSTSSGSRLEETTKSDHQGASKVSGPGFRMTRRPSYDPSVSTGAKLEENWKSDHIVGAKASGMSIRRQSSYDIGGRDKNRSSIDIDRNRLLEVDRFKVNQKNDAKARRGSASIIPHRERDVVDETDRRRASYGDNPRDR